MDKVRFGSTVKYIEVNDAGEYITIDTGDTSFYTRFNDFRKWLMNEQAKARMREAEKLNRKESNCLTVVDEASETIEEFVSISKEVNTRLDALFGEGCMRKAFPDSPSPTLDRAVEFITVIAPFVEKYMNERNTKISGAYNGNRKGANSK